MNRFASAGGSACVIYEWPRWQSALALELAPQAVRISARPNDTVDAICRRMSADVKVFIFHIDATFTAEFPLCRRELIEKLTVRGIHVINGEVTDISKRTIQRLCRKLGMNSVATSGEGDPDELLILKTNHNCGAWVERRSSRKRRRALGMGKLSTVIRGHLDYKVLPRREMDDAWWLDDQLIVEKYVDNRKHRFFRIYILLDRIVISDVVEHTAIRKMANYESRRNSFLLRDGGGVEVIHRASDFAPDAVTQVLRLADEMSLSYGSLDVMMDDAGECYIIDVNATPGRNRSRPQPGMSDHLCAALNTGVATPWYPAQRWREWLEERRIRF